MDVITNDLLTDRYRVGDLLGRGGMSVVLRGRDLRLDREVAIKVLRADLVGNAKYEARFRLETRNAASLNHPAIVGLYDTGSTAAKTGVTPYVVMEFVDGETLRELLAREGALPWRRALEIAADLCAALDFAHRHGIVHRNVSPKNVLIDRNGAIKVMDFGVAGSTGRSGSSIAASSVDAAGYLSPEQARGDSVDARSDVYSAGCVLYEMLTGAVPFVAASAVAAAYEHLGTPPRPPSAERPELSTGVDALVLTAMAKDPLDRYQTAAAFRAAVSRALTGRPDPAPAQSPDTLDRRRAMVAPGAEHSAPVPLLAPPVTKPPDDDWAAEPAPRRPPIWGVIGIAVLCLAVLVGALWLTLGVITAAPPAAPVAVPDLSGKTRDEAAAILQGKKLTVGSITEVESTEADDGRVVDQRPSGQTQVGQGTSVNLSIGRGITQVRVPDLVGGSADSAKNAVADSQLVYAEQQQPSSDADRGRVLAQVPDAQTAVPPGSTITVTVGTGQPLVTVPENLVGKSADEASQLLQAAGLSAVTQDGDGTEPVGQVIATDQPGNRPLPQGTPVTLTVSNNTLMVMPALQSQAPNRAVATLQNLGWAGDLGTLSMAGQATPSQALIGAVISQTPAAGSVVPKIGTPVHVGVGVRQITVPNLVGKTQAQAAALLGQAGATNVTFVDVGTAPRGQAGKVKSQSVPVNSPVAADTPIAISVYRN